MRIFIHIGFLLSLSFFIVSCQDNSFEESESRIEDRISDDLNNPPAHSYAFDIDTTGLPRTKYISDDDHSSISFKTKHWEIVNLVGWFQEFEVVMYSDAPDFSDAVIHAWVNPNSIRMPNIKMQQSVQQAPYIDTEEHPDATFQSTRIEPKEGGSFNLTGKLNLNGIEKEVLFDVTFNGFAYPNEKSICGFEAVGMINRHDFAIAGDARLHSGKQIHDDMIELSLSLRME